jgi:hypothetical protein
LRKIHRPTYENGYWRIQINQEIYTKFKPPATVTIIKVCRFEWLWQAARMDGTQTVKANQEHEREGKKNYLH